MRIITRQLLLSLLISCICASMAAAQGSETASAAERRAKEFSRLIDSGSRAELRKYAAENFAPAFLKIPMEQHLGFLSSVHDSSRGVEFHSIQESKANEVTALLKNKLTGEWLALFVRVEPEPPYRIAGLGLRPPKPPATAESAKKLSNEQIAQELKTFVTKLAEADV